MTKKDNKARQSMLIETLKQNHFDINDACKQLGITVEDFAELQKDESFAERLKVVEFSVNNFSKSQLMKLVAKGDPRAIIEHNKWLRQEDDEHEKKLHRKRVMSELLDYKATKADCLKTFSYIFDESAKMAEKYYQTVLTEERKLSPAERLKKERQDRRDSMHALIKSGEINEEGILIKLAEQAAYDAENSPYPRERSAARNDLINLMKAAREKREEARREAEQDATPLYIKMRAAVNGTSPEMQWEFEESKQERLNAIESS